jgi:protein involved in polysaccharide export with SLBB domain
MTSPLSSIAPQRTPTIDKSQAPSLTSDAMIFGSAIDAHEYHVGPGDVFQCRYWTNGESAYLPISADQVLVVPLVGEFDTRGKTLANVRDEVYQKAGEVFKESKTKTPPLSLTLVQPRRIYVTVKGNVESPSVYVLTGSTRADIAIALANKVEPVVSGDINARRQQELEDQRKRQLESLFGERAVAAASQRYVSVAHADGTTDRVDLVRYNALHDPWASPPLREGDVIIVPPRNTTVGSIGVYGAVQSPGDFEFVPGDSLTTAIRYVYGPTLNADLQHVELVRVTPTGELESPKVLDLTAIQSHAAPDVPLRANDRIIVHAISADQHAAIAAVRGEVNMPGVYPIVAGETKLSEIVKQAGGLKSDAYPGGGSILRHGKQNLTSAGTPEEIRQTARLANLTVADTASFQKQMSLRLPTVAVDIERALQGDADADVMLQDGDEIIIPERPTTVYVSGFVNNAGYVTYQSNAPLSYYIARAGGYAEGAVKSNTFIIKNPSKAWMDASDTKIQPGDEVYVQREPEYSEEYKLQRLTTWATIAGALFGAINVYLAVQAARAR